MVRRNRVQRILGRRLSSSQTLNAWKTFRTSWQPYLRMAGSKHLKTRKKRPKVHKYKTQTSRFFLFRNRRVLVRYIGRGTPPVEDLDGIEEMVIDSGTSPLDAVAAAAAVDFSPRALKSIILFDCDHPRCTVSVWPVHLSFNMLLFHYSFVVILSPIPKLCDRYAAYIVLSSCTHIYFFKHLPLLFPSLEHFGTGPATTQCTVSSGCPIACGHQWLHCRPRPQRALQQG